jgi:hypothetical protein
MKISKATQITCTVYHSVTSKALGALEALGVKDYHLQPSRAVVLRRKAGFLGIGGGIGLEEEPADRILCYVPAADAEATLQALAAACELNIPGRGSAVSEAVDIVAGSVWESHPLTPVPGTEEIATQDDLASITCTVTRGRGDRIVKAVLGLGMPMPQVTTGTGTGLRDKIGVIRVALPSEKEVVHSVVPTHEATDILGSLFDAGRLDRFGAGFIYESPLSRGVINSMVIRGQRHSASIEQLIAAVDDLKGSADWRQRSIGADESTRRHNFIYNLVNLTLVCNEGNATDLVRAAMAAGASGATIVKLSHARFDEAVSAVSPAREMTELIIGEDQVEDIAEVLVAAGLFDANTGGVLVRKPVSVVCANRSVKR